METIAGAITFSCPEGAFPLSTDSMALGHFAKLPKEARVLDLGSGCGTLGLLLCAKDPRCHVAGVEIEERSHLGALENIRRNGLDSRLESICADLRQVPSLFPPGSFSVCVSNPPYFSGGPVSRSHPTARREDLCHAEELMKAAAWALKFGGDFFLVHRVERMAQLIALGAREGLECKRICLLSHREGSAPEIVLLALRKGARAGVQLEQWCLHHRDGSPTPLYKSIYHIKET